MPKIVCWYVLTIFRVSLLLRTFSAFWNDHRHRVEIRLELSRAATLDKYPLTRSITDAELLAVQRSPYDPILDYMNMSDPTEEDSDIVMATVVSPINVVDASMTSRNASPSIDSVNAEYALALQELPSSGDGVHLIRAYSVPAPILIVMSPSASPVIALMSSPVANGSTRVSPSNIVARKIPLHSRSKSVIGAVDTSKTVLLDTSAGVLADQPRSSKPTAPNTSRTSASPIPEHDFPINIRTTPVLQS